MATMHCGCGSEAPERPKLPSLASSPTRPAWQASMAPLCGEEGSQKAGSAEHPPEPMAAQ